ncbi:hypothetical protein OSB04_020895 [Centaurea solstitialis]|uniref:Glycosyltransferase N-terminal domain-containing protein n=1 Tax=Centaurea solstitialis TaxID=347529 RepID=A0AA38TBK6_9ASTR|nr:hypothetical protein OSB04_020895 [Centaurea solstitialis]
MSRYRSPYRSPAAVLPPVPVALPHKAISTSSSTPHLRLQPPRPLRRSRRAQPPSQAPHSWLDPLSDQNIHFHEFPVPAFATPPPDPNAAVRFPAHLMPSLLFAELLSGLSSTNERNVIVHDYLMSSLVQGFVSITAVEFYTFQSCSAFSTFWCYWEVAGSPRLDDEIEAIRKKVPSLEGCFVDEFVELLESTMGAWPMHFDQPRNAMLITKVLGSWMFAREWGGEMRRWGR